MAMRERQGDFHRIPEMLRSSAWRRAAASKARRTAKSLAAVIDVSRSVSSACRMVVALSAVARRQVFSTRKIDWDQRTVAVQPLFAEETW